MVKETDYCGIVSGKKTDKAKLFENFYGKLKTAPMIKQRNRAPVGRSPRLCPRN